MIVESPAKIKKLSEILGPDWKIAASFGHIRDLSPTDLGIAIPSFKPTYEIPADVKLPGGKSFSKKSIVTTLKSLVRQYPAANIYLATDPDREGEAISWHLMDELKLQSNTKRVTFGEVTEAAVLNAVNNPRTLNVHLVYAQEARRCLDRLVGWLVSPILSQKAGKKGLSAGRVQSPALLLVVMREREITNFKPTTHYSAQCSFDNKWSAEWLTAPNYTNNENPYFLDKTFAAKVSAVKQFKVKSFKQTEEKRSPPAPFITVSLQQAASVALNFSPDVTMKLAQALKDAGHITYHRTDNPNVSAESMPDIRAQAAALGLEMHSTQRLFKAKGSAQEGHPAITPTHWEVESAGDTDEQRALYKLIRLRALASQLADANYSVRTVHLSANTDDGKLVEFQAKGRTLIYDGWMKLITGDQSVDSDEDENTAAINPIPDLQPGQTLIASNGKLLEKQTRRPPRYTEATLVGALESAGIGRPATYAAIISNIFSKGYVDFEKKSKKKFIEPMPTAYTIVDTLVGAFGFVELDYTNYIETTLDEIAQGKLHFKDVMKYFYDELQSEIGRVPLPEQQSAPTPAISNSDTAAPTKEPEASIACPTCGIGTLHKRSGKFGPFWSCSAYPNCETSFPDVNGKPNLTPKAASQTQDNNAPKVKCPACGTGSLQLKTGKTGKFWGCNTYPKCKKTISDKNGTPLL